MEMLFEIWLLGNVTPEFLKQKFRSSMNKDIEATFKRRVRKKGVLCLSKK